MEAYPEHYTDLKITREAYSKLVKTIVLKGFNRMIVAKGKITGTMFSGD